MPAPATLGFVVCPRAGHRSAPHYREERSVLWRLVSALPVSLAGLPRSRICGSLHRWPPPSPDFLTESKAFAARQSPPRTSQIEHRPPPTRAVRVQNLDPARASFSIVGSRAGIPVQNTVAAQHWH